MVMARKFQNPNLVVKNGAYLLFRMLLVLFLGFFITRLTLQVLGDEKYGIYNIVGGIIAVFAIISMPVRDSLQRFFNVELANEKYTPAVVFRTSSRIVSIMIIIITILYETVGLFLINHVINYPEQEQIAVNVIFQISAVANIFGFAQLPYLALLFSRENMSIPAICEIVSAIIKILLLYLIVYIPTNILIPYASIFLVINFSLFAFYRSFCRRKYSEYFDDKTINEVLQKDMLSFSGWSFVEAVAGIALTYVSNILINVFGGVLYNTAYGVSKQLQHAVISFSSNVLKAADPQISSSTATENDGYRNQLVMTTSKISFLGVAFVYIVFHFDGPYLLDLWLDKVPKYALEFCDLAILATVFTSISLPYRTLIMATGRIKGYFLTYGLVSAVAMIIMYVVMKTGGAIISAMYIILLSCIVMWVVAIIYTLKLTSIKLITIIRDFSLQVIAISISCFAYLIIKRFINSSFIGIFISILISFLVLCITTYFFVLNNSEKTKFQSLIKRMLRI